MLSLYLSKIETLLQSLSNRSAANENAESDFWSLRKELATAYAEAARCYAVDREYLSALRLFEHNRDLFRDGKIEEELNIYCKKAALTLDQPTDLTNKTAEELYLLGLQAHSGMGVKINYVAARAYYTASAKLGYAKAQNGLGELFEFCKELGIDKNQAAVCYQQAAEQNLPRAQTNFAYCFQVGDGVPENIQVAIQWYKKADLQGEAMGQGLLGQLWIKEIKGITRDYAAALEVLTKSGKQGNSTALNDLGAMHQNAWGVAVDLKKAREYYQQSADLNNHIGQLNIAIMYHKGLGVEANQEIAFMWMKKAAEKSRAWPLYYMGEAYNNAIGVGVDYAEAVQYYRRAIQLKSQAAKDSLSSMYVLGRVAIDPLQVKNYRIDYMRGVGGAANALNNLFEHHRKNSACMYHVLMYKIHLPTSQLEPVEIPNQLDFSEGLMLGDPFAEEHFESCMKECMQLFAEDPLSWITEFAADDLLPLKLIELFIKRLYEKLDDCAIAAAKDFQKICFLLGNVTYEFLPKINDPNKHQEYETMAIKALEKVSEKHGDYPMAAAALVDLKSRGDDHSKWQTMFDEYFKKGEISHPFVIALPASPLKELQKSLQEYILAANQPLNTNYQHASAVNTCLAQYTTLPALVAGLQKININEKDALIAILCIGNNLLQSSLPNSSHDDDEVGSLGSSLQSSHKIYTP